MRRLSDLIAPQFYDVHHDIAIHGHTHYKLYGGRGSTKSSFISVEIVFGMMKDPDANAVVFRLVGSTLRDSVFEQIQWAIEALGVSHLWSARVNPLTFTYIPTGQKILFRGADKAEKAKSIKVHKGYFKYIWFEERAEFNGAEEERKILQSLLRGGEDFFVFYSWNPPKTINHWVNQDVLQIRDDTLCNHSTYLTVPRKWLGEQFFTEADELKKNNLMAYRHEYLGEATGTGGKIFDNVVFRPITDEEIAVFDQIRQGIDFGFAADPFVFLREHYNQKQRRLYIFREIYQVNLPTLKAVDMIKKLNPLNQWITADSEEPRSIAEMNEYGLRVLGAKKGPGSVDFGMNYLQNNIDEIIIDPARCPNAAREFESYELDRDKNGNFKGTYPDRDNHTIDATRYALEADMLRRKARIGNKHRFTH